MRNDECGMRPRLIVVVTPIGQNSTKVIFRERDEEVQILSVGAADQSLAIRIRLRREWGRPQHPDAPDAYSSCAFRSDKRLSPRSAVNRALRVFEPKA